MRILHVVTLVSPDGAFGGPVRVAVNQARELRSRGHQVALVGLASGYRGTIPTALEGVPARLFPARRLIPGAGFSGIGSPALLRWLKKQMVVVDVVHVHLARDLVTLPSARIAQRAGKPVVVQPHGMIDASDRLLAQPLDRALTRRVLRDARAVFHLTGRERDDLVAVMGTAASMDLIQLGNGVPTPAVQPSPDPDPPEVLFLARFAPRKRPMIFVEMAEQLAHRGVRARFAMVGPDEGERPAIAARIGSRPGHPVSDEGPLRPEETIERLGRCSVYVLPAVDEPYPMSVLEAMSVARPVVVTQSCGLADMVRDSGCGIVVDESLESLTSAVHLLLVDATLRQRMGERALEIARGRFGMAAVADVLERTYTSAGTF